MREWLITLLVALVAATPGIYAAVSTRRKLHAETVKITGDDLRETNLQLIEDNKRLRAHLREFDDALKEIRMEMATMRRDHDAEIALLRAQNMEQQSAIKSLQAENEDLCRGVELLRAQVQRLGQQPAYMRKR